MDNSGNRDLDEGTSEKIRNSLERGKIEIEHKYFEGIEMEEDTRSCLFLQ